MTDTRVWLDRVRVMRLDPKGMSKRPVSSSPMAAMQTKSHTVIGGCRYGGGGLSPGVQVKLESGGTLEATVRGKSQGKKTHSVQRTGKGFTFQPIVFSYISHTIRNMCGPLQMVNFKFFSRKHVCEVFLFKS